jgi:hypothetical protein
LQSLGRDVELLSSLDEVNSWRDSLVLSMVFAVLPNAMVMPASRNLTLLEFKSFILGQWCNLRSLETKLNNMDTTRSITGRLMSHATGRCYP